MLKLSQVAWTLKKPKARSAIQSIVRTGQARSHFGSMRRLYQPVLQRVQREDKDIKEGIPLPIKIFIKPDRTFELKIGQPTVSYFLKAAAGIEKGARETGKEVAGLVSLKHIYEIACVKAKDDAFAMQDVPLSSVVCPIIGSAHSLGIRVVKDLNAEELAAFQKVPAVFFGCS